MRVLLADDHALVRGGLASLLRAWGMEVVAEAGNGLEALELTRRLEPDLVLMDIEMPVCDGLEAARRIKAELPHVKIVMVTVSDDDDDLFEAVKAGADGYLLKDMAEDDLERMLNGIIGDEAAFSPGLAARVLGEFARLARERASRDGSDGLTRREQEVLQLVARGATNREIAAELVVSENTVNYHLKNILRKLRLKNRTQAVAYALRTGLVQLPPD